MFFPKNFHGAFAGAVVGTIHSTESLAAALNLRKDSVHFLELRVDSFAKETDLAALEKSISRIQAPLIITVRHPKEGGEGNLSETQRRELFHRFLPLASLVDVELRSALALKDVINAAHAQGTGVILSHHDFQKTPSPARLQALLKKARSAKCEIFKLATMANTAQDLAVLLDFLTARKQSSPSLAVMGMGAFGKISRLTLGNAGSVLNYGYLDKPQVVGQWPAALLMERLSELSK